MMIAGRRAVAGVALAALSSALSAGCSGSSAHSASPVTTTGSTPSLPRERWATYHQPSGPMRLSFTYPANWKATGHTFSVSDGGEGVLNGIAYLEHDLSRPLGASPISAGKCRARARAVRGQGVLVVWTATVGKRFSQLPGRRIRVHGWPARLKESTLSSECAGSQLSHVPEHVFFGSIEEDGHTIQGMSAVTGIDAGAKTLATIQRIFRSTRR